MRPHGSFSDFVRKSSCPCAAARPRRIEVAASSVQASQRDASESRSLTKATRLRRPLWVQQRTSAFVTVRSASPSLADIVSYAFAATGTASEHIDDFAVLDSEDIEQ